MAKLSDLTATTTLADTDIMHLRTTGGLDKKIDVGDLKTTIQKERLELTAGATITMNQVTADLFIQMDSPSVQTVTLDGIPGAGYTVFAYNKGAGALTVTDTGATFSRTITQGEIALFFSDSVAMFPSPQVLRDGTGFAADEIALFSDTTGERIKTANRSIVTSITGSNGIPSDGAVKNYVDALYPIGMTYAQYPSGSTPATMGWPGTWTAQYETEGVAFRTPGGNALAFNGGIQEDAFQGHHHNYEYVPVSLSGGGSASYDRVIITPTNTTTDRVTDPISDGVNGTPRTANETRMRNRTFRVWRRTA